MEDSFQEAFRMQWFLGPIPVPCRITLFQERTERKYFVIAIFPPMPHRAWDTSVSCRYNTSGLVRINKIFFTGHSGALDRECETWHPNVRRGKGPGKSSTSSPYISQCWGIRRSDKQPSSSPKFSTNWERGPTGRDQNVGFIIDKSWPRGYGLHMRPNGLAYSVPRTRLSLSYRQGWKNCRPHRDLSLYNL